MDEETLRKSDTVLKQVLSEDNELEEVQKVPDTSIQKNSSLENIVINSNDEVSNQVHLINGLTEEDRNDTKSSNHQNIKAVKAESDDIKEINKSFNEEEKENELVKNGLIEKGEEEVIDGFSFLSFDSETDLKVLFEIRKRELNLFRSNASFNEKLKKTPSKVKKEKNEFSRQKSSSSSSTTSNGDTSLNSKPKQENVTTTNSYLTNGNKTTKKDKKPKKLAPNNQSGGSNTNSNSSFISNDDEITNDYEITSNLNDSNANSKTSNTKHESVSKSSHQTPVKNLVEIKSESLRSKHEEREFSTNSPKSSSKQVNSKSSYENLIAETEAAASRAAMASLANQNIAQHPGNYPFFPVPGGPLLPPQQQEAGIKFNPFMMIPGANNPQLQHKNMIGQFLGNADHMAMMQKFMEIQNQQDQANGHNRQFPPVSPLFKQQSSQFAFNPNQQFAPNTPIPQPQSSAEAALFTSILSGDPSINPANLPPYLQQVLYNIKKLNDHPNNTTKTNQNSFIDTNLSNSNSPSGFLKHQTLKSQSNPKTSNPSISPSTNNLKNSLPSPLGYNKKPNHSLPHSLHSPKISPSSHQQQAVFSVHPSSNPFFTNNPSDQNHLLPNSENPYHHQLQHLQYLKNVNQSSSTSNPNFVSPKQKSHSKDSTNKTPVNKPYHSHQLQQQQQQTHHHTSNNYTSNSQNPSFKQDAANNLNGQLFKPSAHLTSLNSSNKPPDHSDMFGTTATNSSKGSMSMNHLLASPKQHQHRDHSSMLDTSSLPFNFAQMTGVNSNGLPGFPPFGFDPSNPINSSDFLRQELNSRFLQNLTSGQSQSASPLGMLPPPIPFGANHPFPILPPGVSGLPNPSDELLKLSEKNAKNPNNLMNEQHHHMMMMQQFFRNSLPGLLPPSMVPPTPLAPPLPILQAQPKQHQSSPNPSPSRSNNHHNSKENSSSFMPQPSFSSSGINSQPKSSRPELGLPQQHHHNPKQQQHQNSLPSFSPFNNKNLNSLKVQPNQKNQIQNNNQISPGGNNKNASKWSTAHVKIAHMIMSHESQKHMDKQQSHRSSIPTNQPYNHIFQPFKPSTSNSTIKTKPKHSHLNHADYPVQPSFHTSNNKPSQNAKPSTTASASTFFPPIQSPINSSSTAPSAYGGLASLDSSNKSKFNYSSDPISPHNNQNHNKSNKKSHHQTQNHQSSRDSSKSRQRSRSRSPVSSKSSKHSSRAMLPTQQQPHPLPPFPLIKPSDSLIPPNPLATEAAITAYAQLMMADKHRQDLLRLSGPGSNGKLPPNLMPMMSPFMPGLPPGPGSHFPLNLSHQVPNYNQGSMANVKTAQKSPPVLSPKSFQSMLLQTMPQNLNEADFMRMITASMPLPVGKLTPESSKKEQNQQAINSHNQFLQQFFENVNERTNTSNSNKRPSPELHSSTSKSKKTDKSDSNQLDSRLEEPKSKKTKYEQNECGNANGSIDEELKEGEKVENLLKPDSEEAESEENRLDVDENEVLIEKNEMSLKENNKNDEEKEKETKEDDYEVCEVHDSNSQDTEVLESRGDDELEDVKEKEGYFDEEISNNSKDELKEECSDQREAVDFADD